MPTTSEMRHPLNFSGRVPAKLPQKPRFSQTCSLLSQYLKEKRTLGDLKTTQEIFRPTSSPTNLSPASEIKSMDLLVGFGCSQNTTNAEEAAAPTSTMTIFYGGQVVVFEDFSPEQAKEIMGLASRESFVPISGAGMTVTSQRPADLPIARRNSLHRFLEKRKDRVAAKSSPYAAPEKPSKPDDKSWLSLAA